MVGDLPQQLTRLHDEYRLSWKQLSKIFRVSERQVRLWAHGHQMNKGHEELIEKLIQYLENTEEVIYTELIKLNPPGEKITGNPYHWWDIL